MINNRSLLIVGGLAAVAWLASNSLYVVDETERAVKLRFGEVIEENIQPGLHFKVPITQTIRKFDTRVLTLDTDTSRYLTLEQKAVIVDSYVKWQVVNPTRYYEATAGDEMMAIRLIQPRVDESLRNEFGRLDLQQIIAERRDDLMIGPTQDLDALLREELGVAIVDVRVKRIDLPDDVSAAVFDRMRSEREREPASGVPRVRRRPSGFAPTPTAAARCCWPRPPSGPRPCAVRVTPRPRPSSRSPTPRIRSSSPSGAA